MNKKATYISILLMALLIIGCGTTKNLDTLKREGKAALEQGQSDRAISLFRCAPLFSSKRTTHTTTAVVTVTTTATVMLQTVNVVNK